MWHMARALSRGRRGVEILVFVATVAMSTVLVALYPAPGRMGLTGKYWDNPGWLGDPVSTVVDAVPDEGAIRRHLPAAADGPGSAEWQGFLVVERAGPYRFELTSDDGSWLHIDDCLIVDNGDVHGTRRMAARIDLTAGPHAIRVRYFQAGGGLALRLRWTGPDGRNVEIPAAAYALNLESAEVLYRRAAFRPYGLYLALWWGCLLAYLPFRVGGGIIGRLVRQAPRNHGAVRAFGPSLVFACIVLTWGINWGLPTRNSWAPDEIAPNEVVEGVERGFSGGWHSAYPPLQYYLLALPVSPFMVADRFGWLEVDELTPQSMQLLLMRLVSLGMSLGTLTAAFLIGIELGASSGALFGMWSVLLTPVFLYYGKMANVDVPYLFWYAWALWAFVRIAKTNQLRDYVTLGVTAAASVATKEQAYGYFTLLPVAVLVLNWRHQRAGTRSNGRLLGLFDRKIVAGGLAAAATLLVVHNPAFNPSGVMAHLDLAQALKGEEMVPRSSWGQLQLAGLTVSLLRWSLGWPLFLAALFGIVQAARHAERRWWLWLLTPVLSYHLTFTSLILSVYDRFLIGMLFVLALFAGSACADLVGRFRRHHVGHAVAGGVFVFSCLNATSVNYMMTRDARYEIERWADAARAADSRVWLLGPPYYQVRMESASSIPLQVVAEAVRSADADFIVANERFMRRLEARSEGRAFLDGLEDGTLGFEEILRCRGPLPPWALLQYEERVRDTRESGQSNLDKINPEMVVYRRTPK